VENCRNILRPDDSSTILPQFFPAALPVQGPQNLSTIFPQFFYNFSSFGRIWCIRIGLEKSCRRKNRRRIVETFGECRPRRRSQDAPFRVPLFIPTRQNSSASGTTATSLRQNSTSIANELRALYDEIPEQYITAEVELDQTDSAADTMQKNASFSRMESHADSSYDIFSGHQGRHSPIPVITVITVITHGIFSIPVTTFHLFGAWHVFYAEYGEY
jgi:hypothetical protein